MTRPIRSAILAAVTVAAIVVASANPALASPTILLDPSEGLPGTEFVVSGNGFPTGEKVQLRWEGKPLGRPVTVDASGSFAVLRSVPIDAIPGEYLVTASLHPGDVVASATFTVAAGAPTTTTTAPADETTTTTAGGTATTTTTEASTTSTTVTGETGGLVFAVALSIDPPHGPPGTEFEVEGRFTGPVKRVKVWMGDVRLGPPVAVGSNGLLAETFTVPELDPGLYWLRIETLDGEIITARTYKVTERDDTASTPSPPGLAWSVTSTAYLVLALLLLVALLSVWWMWRKTEEEEPVGQASVREES